MSEVHLGVKCAVCAVKIYNTRFKCIVCDHYNLCCDCEYKGNHRNHVMLRIGYPFDKSWQVSGDVVYSICELMQFSECAE